MFQQLLQKIATALDKKQIPYMLIGGQAVLLYGEPRLTRDIDVTLDARVDKLADLLQIIQELKWQVLVQDPEAFVQQTMVLPVLDPETQIRIDFIFSYTPYEHQAMQRVKKVKIGNVWVRFASPEDLIIHKIIAGRPRDFEDVRGILLKNCNMDKSYIIDWLKQFEDALQQPYVSQFEKLWKEVYG